MNEIEIHVNITKKLEYFINNKKIPNIIFHGCSGSGKKTILNNFIKKIYENNNEYIKDYTIFINCAQGKGIKLIREDLKFFAKTNINFKNGYFFKSIILLNADKLTIDAQSALRRCIELFSHTTRFFVIVEDKYKLLKPILSRFCEIYIPLPRINNKIINLHKYNLNKVFNCKKNNIKRLLNLNKLLNIKINNYNDLFILTEKLYEKAYSALDILKYIDKNIPDNFYKYQQFIIFQKFKKEIRNEKICILFLLNNIFFRYNDHLENISIM